MGPTRDEYLIVQQIYRGWALLGVLIFGAMKCTRALSVLVRKRRRDFALVLAAFLCIAAGLAVFFAFTFPANQATNNWTVLPDNWESLRTR